MALSGEGGDAGFADGAGVADGEGVQLMFSDGGSDILADMGAVAGAAVVVSASTGASGAELISGAGVAAAFGGAGGGVQLKPACAGVAMNSALIIVPAIRPSESVRMVRLRPLVIIDFPLFDKQDIRTPRK